MFKKLIRSHAMRRRVSWGIAAILILPFIFFFHATGQAPPRGPGGSAGKLFGASIPWEIFQQQERWVRLKGGERWGEVPAEILLPYVHQQAWNQLLLLAEAKRQRLHISDQELQTFIQQIPGFQDAGHFRADYYHNYVRNIGLSPSQFESLVRQDLLAEKLLKTVRDATSVTEEEVREAYRREHEALKSLLILFEPSAYTAEATAGITQEALQTYYEAHPEEVRVPEQITIEYAGSTREELNPRTQPSEEAIQAFYEEHRETFAAQDGTVPPLEEIRERVRTQVVEEQVRNQLKALALDLQEDLESTLSWEEILKIRALSVRTVGPFAATSFWIADGPEPTLIQALKDLPLGQLSDVVETDLGTYVGRVTERVPSKLPPMEDVREQVRAQLIQQRSRELAKAAADAAHQQLSAKLDAGVRAEEALLQVDLPSPRIVQFTRTQAIEPLGTVPEVNTKAFETPLGHFTAVLETPSAFVILRPEARVMADESAYAQVEVKLREETLTRKRAERVAQWVEELRQRAKLETYTDINAGS